MYMSDNSTPSGAHGLDPHLLKVAWSVSEQEFQAGSSEQQTAWLDVLLTQGVMFSQVDDGPTGWTKELNCYDRVILLGKTPFDSLNDDAKVLVLGALDDASKCHRKMDDSPIGWGKALDCYELAISLGEPRFDSLTDNGKAVVLKALSNAGMVHFILVDSPIGWARALDYLERAAVLGRPLFDTLNDDIKSGVLLALVNAGVMHRKLDDSPSGWAKELKYNGYAAALGESLFSSLDDGGKASVLRALVNSGVRHSELDDSPTAWAKASGFYERAIALGESRFDSLDDVGKASILSAWVYTGHTHGQLNNTPNGRAKALYCHEHGVALVEQQLQRLNAESIDGAREAVNALEATLHNSGRRPSSALPLGLVMLPGTESRTFVNDARTLAQVPRRNRSVDGPGSDRWLTKAKAFPADVSRPEQARTVRRLAQARLAIHAQIRDFPLLGQRDQQDRLVPPIARHIAQAKDLPVQCESLAHWLLALLSVHAPQLVAQPSHRHWQVSYWSPDLPAIAQALRFDAMRFEDGSFRAPYYWATLLAHGELDGLRYHQVPDDNVTASQWMGYWLDRSDGKALSEALQLQWLNLVRPTQELAKWLGKQGVAEPLELATWACLSAQADRAIAQALQSSAASQHQPSALNHWLTELANAHEGRQATEWALAQTLQRFCQGGLSQPGVTPNELWELLESARVGLGSKAHPSKQRFDEWDEEAVKAIHAGELRALDEAERHINARQAGNPLPTPDQVDGPLEPFTSMAQQWQRMGVGLVFETPASAAALLRPGQSLVQLWWGNAEQDPSGLGQALWLRKARGEQGEAGFELQHLMLPQPLERSAIVQMLQPWAEQGRLDRQGSQDYDMIPLVQATQEAWDCLMAPGSVARQLLEWLGQFADEQLSLILPHELSNLPWQALHEQVQQEPHDQQPSSTPVTPIELVPSVSAWAQARRASTQAKPASSKALKASLVMADDIFRQRRAAASPARQPDSGDQPAREQRLAGCGPGAGARRCGASGPSRAAMTRRRRSAPLCWCRRSPGVPRRSCPLGCSGNWTCMRM
jgi:hypothetical protein